MCVCGDAQTVFTNRYSCVGMWSELLGIGDFYYELGVQAVEACMSSRAINGGLMEINQLVEQVRAFSLTHCTHSKEKNLSTNSVSVLLSRSIKGEARRFSLSRRMTLFKPSRS